MQEYFFDPDEHYNFFQQRMTVFYMFFQELVITSHMNMLLINWQKKLKVFGTMRTAVPFHKNILPNFLTRKFGNI